MSLGLLTRACLADCWWARWRRVLGIADQGVVWVALCLSGGASGWRCAMGIAAGRRVLGIADQRVGAALCHGDCWWACRVGGAVS